MVTDLQLMVLAILTVLGALTAAVLGWLDSGEAFEPRKFSSSLLRAIIAGLGIFLGFQFVDSVTVVDYVLVFLAGAGVDVLGHRAAKTLRPPASEPTEPS